MNCRNERTPHSYLNWTHQHPRQRHTPALADLVAVQNQLLQVPAQVLGRELVVAVGGERGRDGRRARVADAVVRQTEALQPLADAEAGPRQLAPAAEEDLDRVGADRVLVQGQRGEMDAFGDAERGGEGAAPRGLQEIAAQIQRALSTRSCVV